MSSSLSHSTPPGDDSSGVVSAATYCAAPATSAPTPRRRPATSVGEQPNSRAQRSSTRSLSGNSPHRYGWTVACEYGETRSGIDTDKGVDDGSAAYSGE